MVCIKKSDKLWKLIKRVKEEIELLGFRSDSCGNKPKGLVGRKFPEQFTLFLFRGITKTLPNRMGTLLLEIRKISMGSIIILTFDGQNDTTFGCISFLSRSIPHD